MPSSSEPHINGLAGAGGQNRDLVLVEAKKPIEFHILNLGAGVQSTTLYLLSIEGRIQRFDAAIFADTQDETAATYAHLKWMQSLDGPPILVRSRGCLSADLMRGENSTGQKFASIPAYTAEAEGGDEGQLRRQCTKEYKVEVIERTIRREILELSPRQHVPKGLIVHQSIGISWDERSRAFDIRRRFLDDNGQEKPNWRVHFPLLTINGEMQPGWTRHYCETEYLPSRVPHETPPSSCKQCPYHSDADWQKLKQSPEWSQIVQIDTALRTPGVIVNRGLDQQLYLHRSCRPIDEIEFANEKQLGFAMECEGGCGL